MTSNNLTIKVERKASISSVRSREQLLELESAYFARTIIDFTYSIFLDEMNTMKQRRTKIIATLCEDGGSVDIIRECVLSGMNIIRVNMAYCSQKISIFR